MSTSEGETTPEVDEGGRPTKYKAAYAKQVFKLCLLGATDDDIAEFFDVAVSTVNLWKLEHPKFSESIKAGKTKADAEVAESLRHRALGYSHADVDIRVVEGEIVETPITKHYPPDTAAAIFWLKNRQKKDWRDKQEQEVEIHGNMTVETVDYAGAGGVKRPSKQEPSDADEPANDQD